MRTVARHTWFMVGRQVRNLIRQPIWIVIMLVQPMIWLILYGQLFSNVRRCAAAPVVRRVPRTGRDRDERVLRRDVERHVDDRRPRPLGDRALPDDAGQPALDRALADRPRRRHRDDPGARDPARRPRARRPRPRRRARLARRLPDAALLAMRLRRHLAGTRAADAPRGVDDRRRQLRQPAADVPLDDPDRRQSMPDWIHAASRWNPVDWGAVSARNAVVYGGPWGTTFAHLGYLLALTAADRGVRDLGAAPLPAVALARRATIRQITWPVPTASPAATERSATTPSRVRVHLVLHLHRLDDADHLARLDGVARRRRAREDGALHRADDRVLAGAAAPPAEAARAAAGRARGTAARARAAAPRSAGRRPPRREPLAHGSVRAAALPLSHETTRPPAAPAPPTRRRRGTSPPRRSTGARAARGGSRAALDAADLELVERAQHPVARVLAVDAVHDQLRDHRVVELRDRRALRDARVDANPGPDGSR